MILDYNINEERIDALNALELENKIMDYADNFKDYNVEGFVFNVEKVEYLSSEGLKVFLKCRKKWNDITLLDANDFVHETFEMVGFDNFIKFAKSEIKPKKKKKI